jgi:hypothetical protein
MLLEFHPAAEKYILKNIRFLLFSENTFGSKPTDEW